MYASGPPMASQENQTDSGVRVPQSRWSSCPATCSCYPRTPCTVNSANSPELRVHKGNHVFSRVCSFLLPHQLHGEDCFHVSSLCVGFEAVTPLTESTATQLFAFMPWNEHSMHQEGETWEKEGRTAGLASEGKNSG